MFKIDRHLTSSLQHTVIHSTGSNEYRVNGRETQVDERYVPCSFGISVIQLSSERVIEKILFMEMVVQPKRQRNITHNLQQFISLLTTHSTHLSRSTQMKVMYEERRSLKEYNLQFLGCVQKCVLESIEQEEIYHRYH